MQHGTYCPYRAIHITTTGDLFLSSKFDVLHAGCTSVGVDVWLKGNGTETYVGRGRHSLSEGRTLRSLYLDPLINLLDRTISNNVGRNSTTRGIFDTNREQTLVLLLDLKTEGKRLLPCIQEHTKPLREADLLSSNDGKTFISRAITIVVTGNAPYDLIAERNTHRDIFFEAPLDRLRENQLAESTNSQRRTARVVKTDDSGNGLVPRPSRSWNSTNSFYANNSFRRSIGYPWIGRLSSQQLGVLRGQIEEAHARGLRVRYSDTPAWPAWLRDRVWQTLLDEGVDVLNVNDLRAAEVVDWGSMRHA